MVWIFRHDHGASSSASLRRFKKLLHSHILPFSLTFTMGNSASTEGSVDPNAPTESGWDLGPNLQAQVVQEFNAKMYAEQLQAQNNRAHNQAAQSESENALEQYLVQRRAFHEKLDNRIDQLNATFNDKMIAADYDASALQKKYVKREQILSPEAPCADVRNAYVSCQQNIGTPTACEIYVQALQDCVTKAVVKS